MIIVQKRNAFYLWRNAFHLRVWGYLYDREEGGVIRLSFVKSGYEGAPADTCRYNIRGVWLYPQGSGKRDWAVLADQGSFAGYEFNQDGAAA